MTIFCVYHSFQIHPNIFYEPQLTNIPHPLIDFINNFTFIDSCDESHKNENQKAFRYDCENIKQQFQIRRVIKYRFTSTGVGVSSSCKRLCIITAAIHAFKRAFFKISLKKIASKCRKRSQFTGLFIVF